MKNRGPAVARVALVLAATVPLTFACATLKKSHPILQQDRYEKMLAGPIEADYVGQKTCLAACHAHDRLASYLERSVHGQQVNEGTGMPLFDCETCHGPGSLAIENVKQNKQCDTEKFVKVRELPPGARQLLCLRCHEALSMTHLQHWATSQHAMAGVSCPDCHQLHKGKEQKPKGEEISKLCFGCHQEVKGQMAFFSRHPVPDGKMTCVSCHDPHGTGADHNLKAVDTQTLCSKCHGEKSGPFLFEHGGTSEGCVSCHTPHGSPFRNLLAQQEPFLCLQCHAPHGNAGNSTLSSGGHRQAIFTKCTNCHSQIHGTDVHSAVPGNSFIK